MDKQRRAAEVVQALAAAERLALSVQCLTEFYSTTTLRLPDRLPPATALAQVGRLMRIGVILDLTPPVVLEACRGSAAHQLSIWDALIWASAKMNGIPYVLTEDAEHGRFLEGVTYLDPFDPRFELAPLVG
ncbi:MAG TPA: PIN domain-containing protein [Candidatus Limnocylindrales bacterium]|nr:PIN domain-containing protein [Candidatus Limnocylindrales bacterium]